MDIALALSLSAVILVSGEGKFSNPAFHSAQNLVTTMPGQPHMTWGCMFLVLAVLLLACLGRDRPAVWSLRFGMVVYLFLAVACLWAGIFHGTDEAGVFIGIAALVFSIKHLVLSVHLDCYGWQ